MQRPRNMCKKTRKTGAGTGQCSMGVFSVTRKEQGKLSLVPNFMSQKKLIVRKETRKTQKIMLKIYIYIYIYKSRNHDLWEWLVKTIPEKWWFKILWEPLMLRTTWIFSEILKTGAILTTCHKNWNPWFLKNKWEPPTTGWNNRPTLV
jgi:hypothetical protein